jgi:5-methylcytosine-specific restriction endonuclease McrA
MRETWIPATGAEYGEYVKKLRDERRRQKAVEKQERRKRRRLTSKQRIEVLAKTGSRCHICGGKIDGDWEADHVLSRSKGGEHTVANYLPAHTLCNNYRWDYMSEEFQEILKLGVWARTQAQNNTKIGRDIAEGFVKYETNRIKRRK